MFKKFHDMYQENAYIKTFKRNNFYLYIYKIKMNYNAKRTLSNSPPKAIHRKVHDQK